MRRISLRAVAGCLAVLCWLAGDANAQIQQRSDGRLRDANPMVGSAGINPLAPRQPINPNLIVSGNVTGGQTFRGFSPIRDSSQFYVNLPSSGTELFTSYTSGGGAAFARLPSAALSDFTRDTVNVQDVLGGVNVLYQPRPYFSTAQTIVNTGAIVGGLNLPGTSVPRSSYELPYQDLQLPQAQMVVPKTPDAGDTRLETGSYLQPALSGLSGQTYSNPAASGANLTNPWIAQSDLFSSNAYLRQQQQGDALSLLKALRAKQSADLSLQADRPEDSRLEADLDLRRSRLTEQQVAELLLVSLCAA